MYYLGIYFGGLDITAGVVTEEGDIVLKGSVPTLKYRGIDAIIKDMAELCIRVVSNARLDIEKDIEYIGIGILGTPDNEKGMINYSSYFDFYDVPLVSKLKEYINLPIYLENDSNCFALAESMFGAAREYNNSVTITLNYDIGAGIIIDRKIYNGAFGGAGEAGHQVIVFEGEHCNCGRRGCWEAYASASAIVRDARIQAIRHPESEMFKMVNGDIRVMSYDTPFEAAKTGDKWAIEIVGLYTRYLAAGLINILNIIQPEVIVISGRMSLQGDYLLKPLKDMIARKFYGNRTELRTIITIADLGNDAAIIGAALIRK